MKSLEVYYTDHYVNQLVSQFFAKANSLDLKNINQFVVDQEKTFVSYGILRETGKIFLKSKDYIYIDHGYMHSSNRKFTKTKATLTKDLGGYFRVVKNDFYFNQKYENTSPERFNSLNLSLKDLNKNGEMIVLSEPSSHTLDFLNIPNWTEQTISQIKKYTDRKIIIHNKFSEVPLFEVLNKAFAFVSCQSTAAFKSIIAGVPSYFTHDNLKKFGEIQNIEKRTLNYDLLYIAANSQWKLKEFFSDDFKDFLNKI